MTVPASRGSALPGAGWLQNWAAGLPPGPAAALRSVSVGPAGLLAPDIGTQRCGEPIVVRLA